MNTNDKYTPVHTLPTPKHAANHNTCLNVRDTKSALTGGIMISAEIKKIPTTLNANTTAMDVTITNAVLTVPARTPRVRAKGSSKQTDVKSR